MSGWLSDEEPMPTISCDDDRLCTPPLSWLIFEMDGGGDGRSANSGGGKCAWNELVGFTFPRGPALLLVDFCSNIVFTPSLAEFMFPLVLLCFKADFRGKRGILPLLMLVLDCG